jgi:uncharacterized protein
MKKLLLFSLFTLFALIAYSQINNQISIGKIDTLHSKILGENRKIWVHVPGNEAGGIYAKSKYPVLYLLDGDAHFSSVVGMIQQLSTVNGNSVLPEMIVVGITNTNRTRDLTPVHVDSDPPFMDSTFSKKTGGGENFIAFMEKELMPYIDANYPTQPYKILVGHSFGGLAVMQVLTKHTDLFNAYVCIDPSMWYNKMNFLKETKKVISEKKFDGKTLYLGIANTMSEGMTAAKLAKDTVSNNNHIRSIFALDKHIKASKTNGLRYLSKYYPNDTHSSVPLITEYDGLRYIFEFNNFKITDKDYTDTTDALAKKYEKHYANVSKQYGYKVSPPESQINANGYEALGEKHYKKAESFFKLNIANYPESFNVFDSYADYFIAKKDTANAILNLQKALKLKENPDSRKKLEELFGAKK